MAARVAGLLLAAGGGRRFGGPKALAVTDGVPWVLGVFRRMRMAGCSPVIVVIGAAADSVADLLRADLLPADRLPAVRLPALRLPADRLPADLLPAGAATDIVVVRNEDWDSGMASSLRLGLAAAADTTAEALMVMLVDLPGVTTDVLRRQLAILETADASTVLAQATFGGTPGHPVLIGRSHWAGVASMVSGDRGANGYLRQRGALLMELGPAADGADVDAPRVGVEAMPTAT